MELPEDCCTKNIPDVHPPGIPRKWIGRTLREKQNAQNDWRVFLLEGMSTDVATFINSCVKCRERKRPKPNRQGEVGQIIVGEVFDTLAMDIVTNLPEDEGHKHILSVIDVFTRYAWAIPLRTREAAEVADALANNNTARSEPSEPTTKNPFCRPD